MTAVPTQPDDQVVAAASWLPGVGVHVGATVAMLQVDGFQDLGEGHARLAVDLGYVGGRFGIEDADCAGVAGEEESAAVPDLAAGGAGAASGGSGGLLGSGVLVLVTPGRSRKTRNVLILLTGWLPRGDLGSGAARLRPGHRT